jgi:hypothetical protein
MRRIDLCPATIYARVGVLPVLAIDLPAQLVLGQFSLAGRGPMTALPRSMRDSVEQSQETKDGTQAGIARCIHAFRRGLRRRFATLGA